MSTYLFAIFASFLLNFILIVPFINFLYQLKFQRQQQTTKDFLNKPTPIFDRFNKHKHGTPIGGGILILLTTVFVFFFFIWMYSIIKKNIFTNYPSASSEILIIIFTFLSFGILGFLDDFKKIFTIKKGQFFGLRIRHKFIIELVLAFIISCLLFSSLKISIIHIPFFGVFDFSYFYIIFATFVIVAFANAVNITDGLDGLASGILMISLFGLWFLSASILDVPVSMFLALWIGALVSFLYFNVYPARLFMGDVGALAFGATLGVVGLLLGKVVALGIIGF